MLKELIFVVIHTHIHFKNKTLEGVASRIKVLNNLGFIHNYLRIGSFGSTLVGYQFMFIGIGDIY